MPFRLHHRRAVAVVLAAPLLAACADGVPPTASDAASVARSADQAPMPGSTGGESGSRRLDPSLDLPDTGIGEAVTAPIPILVVGG